MFTGKVFLKLLKNNEAKYFQAVASSTVLDSLELWNIISSEN
jgi:hypothetical protein